jgi:heme-degrading monooxygenase HmoA
MHMPHMVTVFRSRLRDEHEGYDAKAEEMEAAARAMPGFVDFKSFSAPDGERVSIVVFDSAESHEAWRDDPRHRSAQRQGRDDWYSEYLIQICTLADERRFRTRA